MRLEDFTFVVTTFKSEDIIFNCLKSIPKNCNKIVVENSNNLELKKKLEKTFDNLKCYIMDKNLGYGKANNFGINKSETDYIFILNPDVKLAENTLIDLSEILKNENFSIAAPIDISQREKVNFNTNKAIEVEFVKGFAMILNKKKIENFFFDENIFLYLEEIDLCKRVRNNNGRILLVDTPVTHLGGLSHGNRVDFEMEKSRNWHWMWSKFYFNKKHDGYIYGIIKTFPNFLSSLIKTIAYSITKNNRKKIIYEMRLRGLIRSYMLKESSHRPYKSDN